MKLPAISVQTPAKALILSLLFAAATLTSAKDNPAAPVVGDWHGSSTCLVKPSACHDEEALYHVRTDASGNLRLQADKIVDGNPVQMGDPIECVFDAQKNSLHCSFEKGYVDLTLAGDSLSGAMFLTDKTRWREIKLVRVKK